MARAKTTTSNRPRRVSSNGVPGPTRPLLELDGYTVRRMAAADLPFVLGLQQTGANHLLIDLPSSPEQSVAFLQQLETQPWATLMVAEANGMPMGALATGLTNLTSLNTFVLAMFADPDRGTIPLGLFTRHLFWTYPLQRAYVQFPLLDETAAYADLYASVGFRREGVMKQHQAVAGIRRDVGVFGLLRADFDRWWAKHDPRLSL
jgi:hypothetical protein